MTPRAALAIALAWAAAPGLPDARAQGVAGVPVEKLVPAVFRQLTDDEGNEWNLQQNGVLGRTQDSLVSGGLVLQINNNPFHNYQPLMTEDGQEYVLDNNQQNIGLQVTRRIRLLEGDAAMRFVETLTNPGGAPVSVMVELRSNLGGRFKAVYTDRGRENPASMEKRESGVLVVPKTKGHKALAFTLASPKAALKPTITQQNEYQLNFHYQITIGAGETISIAHVIAQVDLPEDFEAKTLGKLFRRIALARHVRTLPEAMRATLGNYNTGGRFGTAALLASGSIEGLGVDRGHSDVLAMGERTRLVGKASCARLGVTTPYGNVEVPFEDVAALVGGDRGRSDLTRVFLRDGQVVSGEVAAENLRFTLPSGATLDLDVPNLDRLVRAETPGEGRWSEGAVALLETYHGDRVAVRDTGGVVVESITPWGPLAFGLDEMLWLSPPEDEPVGHHIELKDGSRFYAYLTGAPVSFDTVLFGTQPFDPRQVRAVVTAAALARKPDAGDGASDLSDPAAGAPRPYVVLAGGQRLIAQVDAPTISAVTNAEVIALPPATVRRMRNLSDEWGEDNGPAVFEIELWGGSVITGQVREAVLPVRVRSELWNVPTSDIIELSTPLPQMSDATREKIATLIRDLGHDAWQTREDATAELAEFGFMAAPLLRETLNVNPDPEVRRRVEIILEEIE